ncbi:MAG TPA: helix-turn-helix domain-containing protein [Hyphomicrobiaceae bacterium]|nr:helix-turn-helix domain-containing protein [Hyphomicrobiaceae bacterium]
MTSPHIEPPGLLLHLVGAAVVARSQADETFEAKVRSVREAVARVYGVERELLGRPTRGRSRVAFARQVAMYLAHVTFGLTLTTVGRAFGRDRTTVSHACALVEDARDNPDFDRTLELLEAIARRLASIDSARPSHSAE